MKPISLLLVLIGCSAVSEYRNGLRTSPTYSLDASAMTVTRLETGEVTRLPFPAQKLSSPVRDQIRFSRDGRWLFVPVLRDRLVGPLTYDLNVWDLEKKALVQRASVDNLE